MQRVEEREQGQAVPAGPDGDGSGVSAAEGEEQQLWMVVRHNGADFDSWTKLADLAEKSGSIEKIRSVFDPMLKEYPLCYGYWQKWAKLEEMYASDPERVRHVWLSGIAATPHSPQLWGLYGDWLIQRGETESAWEELTRALDTVGLDWLSGELWVKLIDLEVAHKGPDVAAQTYLRAITTPTSSLEDLYNKFTTFAQGCEIEALMTEEEKAALAGEDSEAQREKVMADREQKFQQCKDAKAARAPFEKDIVRPYFHVHPLGAHELAAWKSYLDFEESQSDEDNANLPRLIKLYERCLVACANYPEFWIRYARNMEKRKGVDTAREVLTRSTSVFTKRQADVFLEFALFEEAHDEVDSARSIYDYVLQQVAPSLLEAIVAYVNFERRQNNLEACSKIYEESLGRLTEEPHAHVFLLCHFARFHERILQGDDAATRALYASALEVAPDLMPAWLAALDFEASRSGDIENAVNTLMDKLDQAAGPSALPDEEKAELRRVHLQILRDRGASVASLRSFQEKYEALGVVPTALSNGKKRKHAPNEAEAYEKQPKTDGFPADAATAGGAFLQQQVYAPYDPNAYMAQPQMMYPGYGAPPYQPGYDYGAAAYGYAQGY